MDAYRPSMEPSVRWRKCGGERMITRLICLTLSLINNMAYWIAGSRLRAGVRGGRPAGDGQGGPTPVPRRTDATRYGKALSG